MNPLQRIMSQTLRYIQRHFAKMAALMLAVLVAVGSLLPYDAMPVLAAGFSVYAIVDVSPPYTTEEISGLADLQGSRATAGFCLYYGSHKYFTSSLNENAALIETGDPSAAAVWFFTKVGNYYKISTMINGVEQFIHTESGSRIELSDEADLFQITETANHSFYLKHSTLDKWLQHSGSGKGIRYYPSNSNSTNARIKIVFADSIEMPDDWYHLNGKSYGLMHLKPLCTERLPKSLRASA